MEKAKIELQKEREFGDIFNAVFGFIGQEFKRLGKVILVFVLPVIILMSIFIIMFQTSYFGMLRNFAQEDPTIFLQNFVQLFGKIFLYLLIIMVVQGYYFGIVCSYIKLYLTRADNFKLWDIYEELRKRILPILGASILTFIIVLAGSFFCFFPGIYLIVALSMFIPLIVIEGQSFGNAFSRSFKLVHKKFWWTLLILIVSIIMLWIMSYILAIPSMVLGISNMLHSIKSGGNPYDMFTPGYIVYSSITSAISHLFFIIPYLAIAFQYFSIVEMEERPSLNQKIDQLGENA